MYYNSAMERTQFQHPRVAISITNVGDDLVGTHAAHKITALESQPASGCSS